MTHKNNTLNKTSNELRYYANINIPKLLQDAGMAFPFKKLLFIKR